MNCSLLFVCGKHSPHHFGESPKCTNLQNTYGNFDLFMVIKHYLNGVEIKNGLQLGNQDSGH
jgi:hypothetical protein